MNTYFNTHAAWYNKQIDKFDKEWKANIRGSFYKPVAATWKVFEEQHLPQYFTIYPCRKAAAHYWQITEKTVKYSIDKERFTRKDELLFMNIEDANGSADYIPFRIKGEWVIANTFEEDFIA